LKISKIGNLYVERFFVAGSWRSKRSFITFGTIRFPPNVVETGEEEVVSGMESTAWNVEMQQ